MNYYNENDPKAAQWLRDLIWAGAISDGEVDTRSIEDVTPNDLSGYAQCHFFAGIGGWSLALRLAGWPDDQPVWTGSCPCQPFSAAGKSGGFADERHLWPAFHWLIQHGHPEVVFGEQVASPDGLAWLDLVQTDLEESNYTTWAADLCAAGVGAPHIRQRLYWLAHSDSGRRPTRSWNSPAARYGAPAAADSGAVRLADADCARSQGWGLSREPTEGRWVQWTVGEGSVALCGSDGRSRPVAVEPGTFPLAHGVSGRVGLLRGYGNAIVPPLAAEFIGAYLDTI